MNKVAIIGAGAAGLMCAYAAASEGASVTVYEKNEKPGKKIYITGKGRCNVTNNVEPADFLGYVVHNARFLTGAIYSFSPVDTVNLLESGGCRVVYERGGRVFPASGKASDVTKCLVKLCEDRGVKFVYDCIVSGIDFSNGETHGVFIGSDLVPADKVVVCTGGMSYPLTGSTGDGYGFARSLGHTIVTPRPSLCGINIKDSYCADMQGLTLKNVELSAWTDNKKIKSLFGEMLFTHFGISGPIVLTMSSYICREDLSRVSLFVDFKPAISDDVLDKRLLSDFSKYVNKDMSNALVDLLPRRAIRPILMKAGLDSDKKVNLVTRAERSALLTAIRKFDMMPVSLRSFDEAVITSGGVDVSEINPKTMESRIAPGVYFCGEVLDVDACTGGFNLQTAFSTGYACGRNINS